MMNTTFVDLFVIYRGLLVGVRWEVVVAQVQGGHGEGDESVNDMYKARVTFHVKENSRTADKTY